MIMLLRLARIFIRLLPYLFEESTELWLGYTINLSVKISKRNANLLISNSCFLTHWLTIWFIVKSHCLFSNIKVKILTHGTPLEKDDTLMTKEEFFSMIDQASKAPTKKMTKEERKIFLGV